MLDSLNQTLIVESIKEQLDTTQQLVTWLALVIVVMIWNGIHRLEEFEVLGLKFTRQTAMSVLAWVYAISTLGVVIHLIRIHELLRFTRGKGFTDAALTLFIHSWLLNPFAFFGGDLFARIAGACGFGLWALIWWASVYSLRAVRAKAGTEDNTWQQPFTIFLWTSGLIALALVFIYSTLILRLFEVDIALGKSVAWSGGLAVIAMLIAWWFGKKAFESLDKLEPKSTT